MKTKIPLLHLLFMCVLLLLISLASAWADLPIQLVGSYDTSGTANGVAVSGSYAYVADGNSGLQVVDISNPASPSRVGGYDTSGSAKTVAVSGSYAYVADATSGLQVIDVSNPASPILIGSCDTSGVAWGVAVSGDYACMADGLSGLQVIDISNPASPIVVGNYDTVYNAYGVAVSGNYAYLANHVAGLQVIDISNPASPSCVGSYNTSGEAYGVVISGSYAYVADGTYGLVMLNISNPASPSWVGRYDTSGDSRSVAASHGYVFLADGYTGLQAIDMSDPASPSRVGGYDTTDLAQGVVISGSYVYLADRNDGLVILRAETSGTQISSIAPAAGMNSGSVSITDLSGLRFQSGAAVRLTRGGESDIVATGVTVVNSMKITCTFDLTGAEPGLWNVMVTNPDGESGTLAAGFTVVGSITVQLVGGCGSGGYADSVATTGGYAYVVNSSAGMKVVNTSTPSAPSVVGDFAMTDTGSGVSVFGNCAYVAKSGAGWKLVDISNPSAPSLIQDYTHTIPPICWNECPCSSSVVGPTVIWNTYASMHHDWYSSSGSYCQYGNGGYDEVIIPLSGTACPIPSGASNGKTGYGIAVSGNHRYEAAGAEGLRVINISDPANPLLVGGYDTSGDAKDLAVWGDCVYIADGSGGLVILRIEGLSAPTISAITPNSGGNVDSIAITNLAGTGFLQSGVTVKFTKAGQSDIIAAGVASVSATKITCSFDLTGAALGAWNVVVTNPDGQSATLPGGFTVTDGIAPVIGAVTVAPTRVAGEDTVHVSVDVTDNVGVTGVSADGTALSLAGGNTWSGGIPAVSALGSHPVTVIASDAAGNTAVNASRSYTTAQVLFAINRDLAGQVWAEAASNYLFGAFGKVASVDGDVFELNDGSGALILVSYPGHGLQVDDYAIAHGVWDLVASPHVLNATRVTKL